MSASKRFDLSGKVAVVTGGSRGIGEGIAVALAEHGADVAIIDKAPLEQIEKVAEKIRSLERTAWIYSQERALTNQLLTLADRIWDDTSGVDILVNNAGVGRLERFNEISLENWRQTFAVNVDAVFFLSQRIAEQMIAAGKEGRIISTSSVNGLVAEAGMTDYNASKGALELLTKSLAIELGEHGITVNSVAPGMIDTVIGKEFEMDTEAFTEHFRQHIPLNHRWGNVEDCVGAVVFLASAAGRYVTGQHIVVDGGILAEQVPRLKFMKPYDNTINFH